MKIKIIFILLLVSSIAFAQSKIWELNVDSHTIKPKGEIWILSVDSLNLVRDDLSTKKSIKPEISISFDTDKNLLDIWNPYHTEYRFFALDTISESGKGEKTHYIKWNAGGQVDPGNVPIGKRNDIPDCRISFTYYTERNRVDMILTSRGITYYYFTIIKEIRSSKPQPRKFTL